MLCRFVRAASASPLTATPVRTFLYSNGQPYDKRWQSQYNFAGFTDPQEDELTGRPRPEDSPEHGAFLGSFRSYIRRRVVPAVSLPYLRRHRLYSPFDLFFLPLSSIALMQFWPLGVGFKILAMIPIGTMICRVKDRTADPILEETYLREMIHTHPQLKKYFKVESMTTLDYNIEWIKGFGNSEEFPEFDNKLFRGLTRLLQLRRQHDQGPLRLRRRAQQGHHEDQL